MNEINKTTKIVEIKSPQPQQQSLSPREEIYGTAEDYQIKRPPKIKEKNFEKINEENNRKIEEEKEEKMREEEKEKKKVEDEIDKMKKTEISNGKKFMKKINGWTENNKEKEENEENIQEELVPEHLRSMLSEEQFGMLEANKRRLEQERRQLRELGVIF
uniref:Uncharacterized protein n=1 Tax=Meloidogyne javanica TaxID=6303 RepID=A0A915ML12_MELJA